MSAGAHHATGDAEGPQGLPGGLSYPWLAPLGATPSRDATSFRVWAPRAHAVLVRHAEQDYELRQEGFGIWSAPLPVPAAGDYRYLLRGDGPPRALPDPCSRHQPEGLRGPSRVFDPSAHDWQDGDFQPVPLRESVLYELHLGTFTRSGTFDAAADELERLQSLGVTAVELMPIAEGPGERGWGYDGVYISAPHHAYGGPAGLQRFVGAAHARGIAVILDVVYNHIGASGGPALDAFGPYFSDRYKTFWGAALNFDGPESDPVREWVLQSAEGFIADFHVDGLRLDAIHAIFDQSPRTILAELAQRLHALRPGAILIAESALNDPRVIRPRALGGEGLDAQWADDFHHSLHTLLTGERDGYYSDFGTLADLAKAYKRPFVYDGQYSSFRRRLFGAPANDRPPEQFVVFSQNHDQVGNRAYGDRLPEPLRPLAAFCLLLSPFTPMLFMGEEYGESSPFQFFTDHIDASIAAATREGRRQEFAAFESFGGRIPDPQDPATFEASKLTGHGDSSLEELYAALIRWRKTLTGEVDFIDFSEKGRWLRLRRAEHDMICNFGPTPQTVPTDRGELLLSTHPVTLGPGTLRLPSSSGALLR